MRLTTLTICNFRSFGPRTCTIEFDHKLNCFIGLNSSGKTTALIALQKLFGSRSERLFVREDFHLDDKVVNNPEEKKTLSIGVKIEFEDGEPAIAAYFDDMVIQEPGDNPYINIRLEATWTPSVNSIEGEIEVQQYFVRNPDGTTTSPGSKKDFNKALFNLFQVIYVPALRKTADQLRYASGSILHRLLKSVNYTNKFKQEFKDTTDSINELFHGLSTFKSIQRSLNSFWESFHKDDRYGKATMNFGAGELDEILRKLEVNFSPGPGHHRKFGVDDLGDGYRSLFYLTLVCTLLEIEENMPMGSQVDGDVRPLLVIVIVEEPENHIAPQLLGRVISIFNRLAEKQNTQVFISSHTPAIVKRLDPEMIFHFSLTAKGLTKVRWITLPEHADEAYKYVKEAVQNYPEIYFAKLVVIGEGDSEEVLFNRLMKVMDADFDDNIISFAPLGHRFVNHIWKLLDALGISHITLLDLDLERHGGGWGRIKYAIQELIKLGEDVTDILDVDDEVEELTEDDLEEMHAWEESDDERMERWIKHLQHYKVFFSAPLDLDFLMLEAYERYYTGPASYPEGGGPRIPSKKNSPEKYKRYRQAAVAASLKDDDALGECYSDDQHDLMIWYKYHFLGRGKPVTHIQVLSQIEDSEIKDQLPEVLEEMFKEIKATIN